MSEDHQPAITIRGIEADDWEDVAALRDSINVVRNTLQLPYQSRDRIREYLENLSSRTSMLVAEVDNTVVGQLGLMLETGRRSHVARLGMMVHEQYQGMGIGSTLMKAAIDLADNWLNVSRIELEVYTDNVAGIALYRKFGFEIEGTARDFAFANGHYIDAHIMARIQKEDG